MKVLSLIIFTVSVFSIFSCKSSKTTVESSIADGNVVIYDDVVLFSDVDIKPVFNGKDADVGFGEYVVQKISYPIEAMARKITGQVVVEFIITKDGSIDGVKVVRSVHRLLDAEAVRTIKGSPNWSPGIQHGEKVNVKHQIDVTFSLK